MGAEPWEYIVPYQPDIRAALKQAREETFATGKYKRPYPELDLLDGPEFFTCSDEEREDVLDYYGLEALRVTLRRVGPTRLRQWLLDTYAGPEIATIEDLMTLRSLCTDGTASALDIDDISDTREPSKATPLTAAELIALYGTDRPTREQAKQNQDYYKEIGRGEAIYFALYKNDQPNEILFAGYSYD